MLEHDSVPRGICEPAPIAPVSAQEEVVAEDVGAVVVVRGPVRGVVDAVAHAPALARRAEGEVEVVPAPRVPRVVQPRARAPPRAGVHEGARVLLVLDLPAEVKVAAERHGPGAIVPQRPPRCRRSCASG